MAVLVLVVLILGIAGRSSANWCVCKDGGSDAALQKTLDYACGAGADCNPIKSNGACYNPNTVKAHCNYAVNSYFQKKGQAQGTCDFSGTATVTTTDPSTNGCQYPASASTVTPTTPYTSNTPTTTTTTTTTPYTATPSNGIIGVGSGLGPSSIDKDYSHGGSRLANSALLYSAILLFSGIILMWG
ncbi:PLASMODESMATA CALLOSE-BINDING PROTEIN 3-like isoform X2 [Mangifera indica]|uniref:PLASMODESMATA CALLOSE-BINDING PROTEIN 3-like isoform X2 n=1 Tax=Mangifera indica TaxID=29780 RepID=UPI001CF9EC58|nr:PLASMODESMATA CALLOSE-BINDING PROTEIN 3-like isoform X2 [Mangifera indica]